MDAALSGRLEAAIVLTRLFLALGGTGRIGSLLSRAESESQARGDRDGARRLRCANDLLSREAASFDTMRDVLAILHGDTARPPSVEASSLAAAFDAAVELSPTASVALYSLGDSTLLGGATQELAALLHSRGLLGPPTRVLEIGCGIGRFAQALAPEVASFTGIDVSKNMIRIAHERCADLPNVMLAVTSGHDLGTHADGSFDLVLAVDSFPYIVATGPGLADKHISECARVLTDGGSLAIFNFAYDEDFGTSRDRLQRVGDEAGLSLVGAEPNPLRSWDGSFFQLLKQSPT
ncbi:MAG: class I SAM-dependent methyltransferase [Methylobacteriaceae bacterium]|nr:class I SAM-dependent methyltransferase [Methylobacteriaceae bacterium]